ncbi:hypothetical protein RRG08_065797 [Elysia crispata]|uniref:Uncharacterized protein n=1 Tax=Elysia crispata TaxID=231223 RepID=A0AAE0ZRS3_9GAST|nr:hypothetical protein RRG08_065797 [Elysia crispata]
MCRSIDQRRGTQNGRVDRRTCARSRSKRHTSKPLFPDCGWAWLIAPETQMTVLRARGVVLERSPNNELTLDCANIEPINEPCFLGSLVLVQPFGKHNLISQLNLRHTILYSAITLRANDGIGARGVSKKVRRIRA